MQSAFELGYDAFLKGDTLASNPFTSVEARNAWENGWIAAQNKYMLAQDEMGDSY